MDHEDTYMRVFEAIRSAGWANRVRTEICWVDAEKIEKDGAEMHLSGYDGIVVPGGFGSRGVEGKIAAGIFAMEYKVPYLGLCLGMQTAVIALARQIGLEHANSTEMNEDTPHPVIDIMADQKDITDKGATMRLGNYVCKFDPKSKSREIYGSKEVSERHRHRYEFNNEYRDELVAAGLRLAGLSPDEKLVEVIEIDGHPFFIGSQFHPEYKSRPNRPHPLFNAFTQAAIACRASAKHTDITLKV